MPEKNFKLYINGTPIKVSKEVYQEYYQGERKEQYFMKDLKKENTKINQESQKVLFLPGREISYDQLLELNASFASSEESLEDMAIRTVLLEQAIKSLSPEEQTIIRELYYLGKTERQVSTELHMAKTTLQRRRDKALKKLREFLEESF